MRLPNTKPSEHSEQVALFEWADLQKNKYPELSLMFAIPNAGKRSYQMARYLRSEGLRSGVPDILLPAAKNKYHGLFIELKNGKNKASENQNKYLKDLNQQGYKAVVCYGFEEAKDTIVNYLDHDRYQRKTT